MSIGENIKKLREVYNLSQKDIAEIAGVTNKAVSSWETEDKKPKIGTIEKIAYRFGLKKSNLIEEDGLNNIESLSFGSKNEQSKQEIIVLTQSNATLSRRFHAMSPIGQQMVMDMINNIEKMEKRN
jgi:transcriptional regulator with XRE-family HTH domain